MKICVVGGRLQGTEATYLAKKAGYEVILIDKDFDVPAGSLADEFHTFDLLNDVSATKRVLNSADAILPATENLQSLRFLKELSIQIGIPYMQDNPAFWISSDKVKSREFFITSDIPNPTPWPNSGFPVIVKPARKSGSVGVFKADNEEQLKEALKRSSLIDEKLIIQKFIDGPALSLEVVALEGSPLPLQITQLKFDETYGCKCAFAPDQVSDDVRKSFTEISEKMAKRLNLTGLMDAQAIVDDSNVPSIIEINARLPSQTPTVVYHSSGVNMVSLLVDIFLRNKLPYVDVKPKTAVIYQHIYILNDKLSIVGEHIMSDAKNLRIEKKFFGVDEAITNLDSGKSKGVATLIVKASSLEEAERKSMQAIEGLMAEFHLTKFLDSSPKGA